MRRYLVALALGATLAAPAARAQCLSDGGSCGPVFSISVPILSGVTGAPLLPIDAVIQDQGAALIHNPNAQVFVTVFGTGPDGGGTMLLPDGGTESSSTPFTAPLSLVTFGKDGGVFTSIWDGGASLFLGDNTVIVSAVKASGARADSLAQTVLFQPVVGGGDGGTAPDAGSSADAGCGFAPDGGPTPCGATGSALSATAQSSNSGGCSTAAGGPPSFLLLALVVMLAGLGRRAMHG